MEGVGRCQEVLVVLVSAYCIISIGILVIWGGDDEEKNIEINANSTIEQKANELKTAAETTIQKVKDAADQALNEYNEDQSPQKENEGEKKNENPSDVVEDEEGDQRQFNPPLLEEMKSEEESLTGNKL